MKVASVEDFSGLIMHFVLVLLSMPRPNWIDEVNGVVSQINLVILRYFHFVLTGKLESENINK